MKGLYYKMINSCCICKEETEIYFRLPFVYTDDISDGILVQQIALCKKCGFIYTKNPFTLEQLENRYKNQSKYEFDSDNYSSELDKAYTDRCIRQKFFIDNLIGDSFGSMLEIGAASGYNLSLYHHKNVLGIEPSALNCKSAKKNYNVDMYNGLFSEYVDKNPDSRFDLVFLSHTLEHIVNPYELIKQCSEISDKYMFIEVPTMDCKFIDEPFGMFNDEHVNCFTLESLNYMMNSLGFQLVSSNIIYDGESNISSANPCISTIWQKTNKQIIRKIISQHAEDALKNYINGNMTALENVKNIMNSIDDNERLAVWGVGNHLSMLLANTSLSKKNIIRFYDSDIKKHSLTLMGKEISSFDEKDIEEHSIDSILISTYTAQIPIKTFLDKHNLKCKIYTLYDDINQL